jgi:hypothetical protein
MLTLDTPFFRNACDALAKIRWRVRIFSAREVLAIRIPFLFCHTSVF